MTPFHHRTEHAANHGWRQGLGSRFGSYLGRFTWGESRKDEEDEEDEEHLTREKFADVVERTYGYRVVKRQRIEDIEEAEVVPVIIILNQEVNVKGLQNDDVRHDSRIKHQQAKTPDEVGMQWARKLKRKDDDEEAAYLADVEAEEEDAKEDIDEALESLLYQIKETRRLFDSRTFRNEVIDFEEASEFFIESAGPFAKYIGDINKDTKDLWAILMDAMPNETKGSIVSQLEVELEDYEEELEDC